MHLKDQKRNIQIQNIAVGLTDSFFFFYEFWHLRVCYHKDKFMWEFNWLQTVFLLRPDSSLTTRTGEGDAVF